MTANDQGKYVVTSVGGGQVRAFLPPNLLPHRGFDLVPLNALLTEANLALGRLDGAASILPDTPLFLYMYVRKEALLSSQIEGTQSSLSDFLAYESDHAPGVPADDILEVSNYVAALTYGLDRLRKQDFPLSLRLIKEIHRILMSSGRGSAKQPGEFRTSQNWIGGTRPGNAIYVPPPPQHVLPCLSDFENFLHSNDPRVPALVKAAIAHAQFESIHPFLDGNGRLGRLLVTFMLCAEGILKEPILYLSLYLKAHRQLYYDLLNKVRWEDAWMEWIEFFLVGVKETSEQAAETARRIIRLFEVDRARINLLGRAAPTTLRVHELFQSKAVLKITRVAEELNVSYPTAAKAIQHLTDLEIVSKAGPEQRGRTYIYGDYLEILSQGTEPI